MLSLKDCRRPTRKQSKRDSIGQLKFLNFANSLEGVINLVVLLSEEVGLCYRMYIYQILDLLY